MSISSDLGSLINDSSKPSLMEEVFDLRNCSVEDLKNLLLGNSCYNILSIKERVDSKEEGAIEALLREAFNRDLFEELIICLGKDSSATIRSVIAKSEDFLSSFTFKSSEFFNKKPLQPELITCYKNFISLCLKEKSPLINIFLQKGESHEIFFIIQILSSGIKTKYFNSLESSFSQNPSPIFKEKKLQEWVNCYRKDPLQVTFSAFPECFEAERIKQMDLLISEFKDCEFSFASFVNIMGDRFIEKTGLGGVGEETILNFMSTAFSVWKKHFVNSTDDALESLDRDLVHLAFSSDLKKTGTSSAALAAQLSQRLEREGAVLFHYGYDSIVGASGHSIICKIVKKESEYELILYNGGDGTQHHQNYQVGNEIYTRPDFYIKRIPHLRNDWTIVIEKLLEIKEGLHRDPDDDLNASRNYQAILFGLGGEIESEVNDDSADYALPFQEAGTCSVTALLGLIKGNLPCDRFYSFNSFIELMSMALHERMNESEGIPVSKEAREGIFRLALETFARNIKKSNESLPERLEKLCIGYIQSLDSRVMSSPPLPKNTQSITCVKEEFSPTTFLLEPSERVRGVEKEAALEGSEKGVSQSLPLLQRELETEFSPDEFCKELTAAVTHLKSLERPSSDLLALFGRNLPAAVLKKIGPQEKIDCHMPLEGIWEEISKENIEEVCHQLVTVAALYLKIDSSHLLYKVYREKIFVIFAGLFRRWVSINANSVESAERILGHITLNKRERRSLVEFLNAQSIVIREDIKDDLFDVVCYDCAEERKERKLCLFGIQDAKALGEGIPFTEKSGNRNLEVFLLQTFVEAGLVEKSIDPLEMGKEWIVGSENAKAQLPEMLWDLRQMIFLTHYSVDSDSDPISWESVQYNADIHILQPSVKSGNTLSSKSRNEWQASLKETIPLDSIPRSVSDAPFETLSGSFNEIKKFKATRVLTALNVFSSMDIQQQLSMPNLILLKKLVFCSPFPTDVDHPKGPPLYPYSHLEKEIKSEEFGPSVIEDAKEVFLKLLENAVDRELEVIKMVVLMIDHFNSILKKNGRAESKIEVSLGCWASHFKKRLSLQEKAEVLFIILNNHIRKQWDSNEIAPYLILYRIYRKQNIFPDFVHIPIEKLWNEVEKLPKETASIIENGCSLIVKYLICNDKDLEFSYQDVETSFKSTQIDGWKFDHMTGAIDYCKGAKVVKSLLIPLRKGANINSLNTSKKLASIKSGGRIYGLKRGTATNWSSLEPLESIETLTSDFKNLLKMYEISNTRVEFLCDKEGRFELASLPKTASENKANSLLLLEKACKQLPNVFQGMLAKGNYDVWVNAKSMQVGQKPLIFLLSSEDRDFSISLEFTSDRSGFCIRNLKNGFIYHSLSLEERKKSPLIISLGDLDYSNDEENILTWVDKEGQLAAFSLIHYGQYFEKVQQGDSFVWGDSYNPTRYIPNEIIQIPLMFKGALVLADHSGESSVLIVPFHKVQGFMSRFNHKDPLWNQVGVRRGAVSDWSILQFHSKAPPSRMNPLNLYSKSEQEFIILFYIIVLSRDDNSALYHLKKFMGLERNQRVDQVMDYCLNKIFLLTFEGNPRRCAILTHLFYKRICDLSTGEPESIKALKSLLGRGLFYSEYLRRYNEIPVAFRLSLSQEHRILEAYEEVFDASDLEKTEAMKKIFPGWQFKDIQMLFSNHRQRLLSENMSGTYWIEPSRIKFIEKQNIESFKNFESDVTAESGSGLILDGFKDLQVIWKRWKDLSGNCLGEDKEVYAFNLLVEAIEARGKVDTQALTALRIQIPLMISQLEEKIGKSSSNGENQRVSTYRRALYLALFAMYVADCEGLLGEKEFDGAYKTCRKSNFRPQLSLFLISKSREQNSKRPGFDANTPFSIWVHRFNSKGKSPLLSLYYPADTGSTDRQALCRRTATHSTYREERMLEILKRTRESWQSSKRGKGKNEVPPFAKRARTLGAYSGLDVKADEEGVTFPGSQKRKGDDLSVNQPDRKRARLDPPSEEAASITLEEHVDEGASLAKRVRTLKACSGLDVEADEEGVTFSGSQKRKGDDLSVNQPDRKRARLDPSSEEAASMTLEEHAPNKLFEDLFAEYFGGKGDQDIETGALIARLEGLVQEHAKNSQKMKAEIDKMLSQNEKIAPKDPTDSESVNREFLERGKLITSRIGGGQANLSIEEALDLFALGSEKRTHMSARYPSLCSALREYMRTSIAENLCKETLSEAKKCQAMQESEVEFSRKKIKLRTLLGTKFYETLDGDREVNDLNLLFQYRSKLLLWKSQEIFSHSLTPEERTIHQLGCGEGKTQVISPLIALRKMYLEDKLVWFMVPEANLPENEKDMASSIGKVTGGKGARRFTFDRQKKIDIIRLNYLLHNLQEAKREHEVVITSAKSMKAFILCYYEQLQAHLALLDPNSCEESNKVLELMEEILEIFHSNFSILDEVHKLFDSQESLIFSLNSSKFLHRKHWEVGAYLMQAIQQVNEEAPGSVPFVASSELSWTKEKYEKEYLPKIVEQLLLNKTLLKELNISSEEEPFLKEYLLLSRKDMSVETSSKLSDWLNTKFETKERLELFRAHTQGYLFNGGKGTFRVHFGDDSGVEHSIPYDGNLTPKKGSCFESNPIMIIYTFLMYEQKGLSKTQIEKLINGWGKSYSACISDGSVELASKAEQIQLHFEELMPEVKGLGITLKTLNLSSPEIAEKVFKALYKNKKGIEEYLCEYVFPSVHTQTEALISTSQDTAEIFIKDCIGFTATPTDHSTYWPGLQVNLQKEFEEQASATFKECSVEIVPEYSWKTISADPSVSIVLDPAAFWEGQSNRNLAMEYLKNSDSKYQECLFYSGKIPFVVNRAGDITYYKDSGIPLEQRLIFYDQVHCVGVDLPQAYDACGVVLIHQELTRSEIIQAIKRLRHLDKGQKIKILVSEAIKSSILSKLQLPNTEEFSKEILINWLEKQEEEQIKSRQLPANLDKLLNVFRQGAYRKLRKVHDLDLPAMEKMQARKILFDNYAELLFTPVDLDGETRVLSDLSLYSKSPLEHFQKILDQYKQQYPELLKNTFVQENLTLVERHAQEQLSPTRGEKLGAEDSSFRAVEQQAFKQHTKEVSALRKSFDPKIVPIVPLLEEKQMILTKYFPKYVASGEAVSFLWDRDKKSKGRGQIEKRLFLDPGSRFLKNVDLSSRLFFTADLLRVNPWIASGLPAQLLASNKQALKKMQTLTEWSIVDPQVSDPLREALFSTAEKIHNLLFIAPVVKRGASPVVCIAMSRFQADGVIADLEGKKFNENGTPDFHLGLYDIKRRCLRSVGNTQVFNEALLEVVTQARFLNGETEYPTDQMQVLEKWLSTNFEKKEHLFNALRSERTSVPAVANSGIESLFKRLR